MPSEDADALKVATAAAEAGMSRVEAVREQRGVSEDELALLTGVPVARLRAEAVGRFELTLRELDAIALILRVPTALLLE
jgi:DNA-binding transcriptional regulator YiaG